MGLAGRSLPAKCRLQIILHSGRFFPVVYLERTQRFIAFPDLADPASPPLFEHQIPV